MIETLKLTRQESWSDPREEATIEVEYREIPHFYSQDTRRGRKIKQYEVYVGGKLVGTVHSFEHHSHTNYAGSMLRRDLGYPIRWAWNRTDRKKGSYGRTSNSPGLYSSTRRGATIQMLGYTSGVKA